MVVIIKGFPGGASGKEPAANAGDIRDMVLIPGSGGPPGGGHGDPLQYSCWRIPWTGEPDGLQSIGSQRIRHGSNDLAHRTHHHTKAAIIWCFLSDILTSLSRISSFVPTNCSISFLIRL